MASLFHGFITSPIFILWILSVVLGIIFLWMVLSRFFEFPVILVTSFLVLFGTNYFCLTVFTGPTVTAFLFTLFLGMILLTNAWQKKMKWIPLLVMLPVMIMISFLSAAGMFILLFPVIVGMGNTGYVMRDTGYRMQDTGCGMRDAGYDGARTITSWNRWKQMIFLGGILAACFILRQYSWFSDPGAGFYFGDIEKARFPVVPANIHRVLFSFKNGWIVYSPVVIFALAGFYILAEKNWTLFCSAFLFILVALVSAAGNPTWWFVDRFGYPGLVETYAVLCLPLGYFIQWSLNRNRITRLLMLLISVLLVSLNLFQTWQFNRSILIPGRMTGAYWVATFGKTIVTPGETMLLEPSGTGSPDSIPTEPWIKCSRIANFDFEQHGDYDSFRLERAAHTGKYGLVLNAILQYSPGMTMPVVQVTRRDSCWISSSGFFFFACPPSENKVLLVMTCVRKGVACKYKITDLSAGKFHPNQWNKVTMSYLIPFPANPGDLLQVYFMNYGKEECFIDDFEVSLCKPTP